MSDKKQNSISESFYQANEHIKKVHSSIWHENFIYERNRLNAFADAEKPDTLISLNNHVFMGEYSGIINLKNMVRIYKADEDFFKIIIQFVVGEDHINLAKSIQVINYFKRENRDHFYNQIIEFIKGVEW